jgi:formyl-CoA transferase
VFADPQVQHLGIASPVSHERKGKFHLVGSAINMEGVTKGIRSPTADAGQHTDEILRGVGYSAAEIDSMRANGVI